MTAVITKNTTVAQGPPQAPLRDGQTMYPYCMYFDGWKHIAYAEDASELIDAMVPGYLDLDEAEQDVARIRLAYSARTWIQALINADTGPEVWAALSDEERAALTGPVHPQPRIDFWDPEVKLVLVETGYAPYTDVDRPISGIADVVDPPNIIWLRPQEEWEFLESLHAAGYISLHVAYDL